MQKPLTVARKEYIDTICEVTNQCGLPAFVVVDTLERIVRDMRVYVDSELQRDMQEWEEIKNGGNQQLSDERNPE